MCTNRREIINPHYRKEAEIFHCDISVFRHKKDFKIVVPCGHCDECLKRRSKSWYSRADYLVNRCGYAASSCYFCTFTLKPEVYEEAKETPYLFVRRFIDRIRKHPYFREKNPETGRYKYRKVKFPYFFVVEFADGKTAQKRGFPSTHRMHYHAILFGCPLPVLEVESLWERFYGRARVETCASAAGIHYCLKYVTKDNDANQYLSDIDARKNGKLIVSHGFGRLLDEHVADYREAMLQGNSAWFSHFIGNYRYPIPKYWKNRCFSKDEVKAINSAVVPSLLHEQIIEHPLPEYRHLSLDQRRELFRWSVLPFIDDEIYENILENGFDVFESTDK